MFNLSRNSFVVTYKMYLGETEIVDDYGNKTGIFTKSYSDPETTVLSVSSNRGYVGSYMFGVVDNYDRVATTTDTTCPIDEQTLVNIDGLDYIVIKKAPWKNSIGYAIKKVDLNDED